jgi:hypothetical protein
LVAQPFGVRALFVNVDRGRVLVLIGSRRQLYEIPQIFLYCVW